MIKKLGGCVDATNRCITAAWRSFNQVLPIVFNRKILLRNRTISSAPISDRSYSIVVKHG